MPEKLAVIFALPEPTPVTKPDATVAALGLEDVQDAVEVRFCVLPSL